jgi:PucR family transcriptional regulator, proline-responsive transcriptional activator
MPDELQDVLDDLASTLGRSVSLDAPDGTLLGYSSQGSDADPARIEAILTRRVAQAVLDYQRSHGIEAATDPVPVPPNPTLGMTARTCLPVRRAGRPIAYLWILDDSGALTTAALTAVRESGRRIEALLPDPAPDVDALLARLFTDPSTDLAAQLATRARANPLQFVVVVPTTTDVDGRAPAPDPGPPPLPRSLLGRAWHHGQLLLLTSARTPWPDGEVVVGHSAPFGPDDAGEVATLSARAIVAAGCAAVDPALPRVVDWDDLGAYRRLLLATSPDTWPEPLPIPEDDRSAPMLRRTLEVYLDTGGDAARSISELGIHRTTFYYRLERLVTMYGIRLDDGLVRTDLHLALKTYRLERAKNAFGWTGAMIARLT